MKLDIDKFIRENQPSVLNMLTIFGVVASLFLGSMFLFAMIAIYAPGWLILVLLGLVVAAAWYRFYKLGYIKFGDDK